MRAAAGHWRVLVTGSRNWPDGEAVFSALEKQLAEQGEITVIHGSCDGADGFAGQWARDAVFSGKRVRLEVYPADWNKFGKRAGPMRNVQMVETGIDVCLAFPLPGSRGTQHCIRTALAAGVPVIKHHFAQLN